MTSTRLGTGEPRKRIGVIAAREGEPSQVLLAALESAFPVRFHALGAPDRDGLDAVLVLDPRRLSDSPAGVPRLVAPSARRQEHGESDLVELADDTRLQRPLRGRAMAEDQAAVQLPLSPPDPRSVLAAIGRRPVWWQATRGRHERTCVSAYSLPSMAGEGALRDHLRPGRFMGLLALLHFLELVVGEHAWERPPLRASFVIDDPNLHWPTYGCLDYHEMVMHAARHGYHVGLAMVPLDGWLANGRAASLVKSNPSALSLLMHGNDHRAHELARLVSARSAEAVVAQALRRTIDFERRSGVPVQRVMVPPHEVCSMSALRAMFRLGLDGACIGQRYPWGAAAASSRDSWPLAKWHPTDVVAGGFAILPRYSLAGPREELVFRALLRQPLILYGHHGDLAEGLDMFSEAAEYISGLGEVQWGSAGWIAQQSFLTRRSRDTLIVQMHSRRATVDIPGDATVLEVRMPSSSEDEQERYLRYGADRVQMTRDVDGWTSGTLEVTPGAPLQLTLTPEHHLDPALVSARPTTPWPLIRRALVEGRDRIQPLTRRVAAR